AAIDGTAAAIPDRAARGAGGRAGDEAAARLDGHVVATPASGQVAASAPAPGHVAAASGANFVVAAASDESQSQAKSLHRSTRADSAASKLYYKWRSYWKQTYIDLATGVPMASTAIEAMRYFVKQKIGSGGMAEIFLAV